MTNIAAFDDSHAALTSGVAVLRTYLDKKPHDFPELSPRDARERIELAQWLVGKTKHTKQQQRTVEQVEANGFSMSVLQMIVGYVKQLKGNKREQWTLWRDLTSEKRPAGMIATIACKRVKELKPTPPKRKIGMEVIRGADGMSMVRHIVPQANAADLKRSLEPLAAEIRKADKDNKKTSTQVMGEAFSMLLATGAGVAQSRVIPMVNIPVDEHARVLKGDYEGIRLACSDGTELSGKEYAERALFELAIYTLLSRIDGAVDNFYDERFATEKQRLALFAENPTCAAPGCSKPFDDCQMHHVIAWKNGGPTNLSNLVPLCDYDNGRNDDDWTLAGSRRKNGHIEKRGPFAYWVSAYGFADRRNEHRLMQLGAARKLFG